MIHEQTFIFDPNGRLYFVSHENDNGTSIKDQPRFYKSLMDAILKSPEPDAGFIPYNNFEASITWYRTRVYYGPSSSTGEMVYVFDGAPGIEEYPDNGEITITFNIFPGVDYDILLTPEQAIDIFHSELETYRKLVYFTSTHTELDPKIEYRYHAHEGDVLIDFTFQESTLKNVINKPINTY